MLSAPPKLRQEPFGAVALVLALVLIVSPLVHDQLWVLHRSGRDALACVIWLLCVTLVAAPAVVSWRRVRLSSSRWRRPYETLALVACLLLFGLVGLVSSIVYAIQSISQIAAADA